MLFAFKAKFTMSKTVSLWLDRGWIFVATNGGMTRGLRLKKEKRFLVFAGSGVMGRGTISDVLSYSDDVDWWTHVKAYSCKGREHIVMKACNISIDYNAL